MSALLALAQACAPMVSPATIEMIVRTESHGNPLAINVNGDRLLRQPRTYNQAAQWAGWLVQHGYNIDAGLMQVNSSNWARLGLTPATVFEPCTNIRAGADVLSEGYARASSHFGAGQRALWAAVSAYNTGSLTAGFHNGYVDSAARAAGVRPPLARNTHARAAARTAPVSFSINQVHP